MRAWYGTELEARVLFGGVRRKTEAQWWSYLASGEGCLAEMCSSRCRGPVEFGIDPPSTLAALLVVLMVGWATIAQRPVQHSEAGALLCSPWRRGLSPGLLRRDYGW